MHYTEWLKSEMARANGAELTGNREKVGGKEGGENP